MGSHRCLVTRIEKQIAETAGRSRSLWTAISKGKDHWRLQVHTSNSPANLIESTDEVMEGEDVVALRVKE